MPTFRFSSSCKSDVGKVRRINEDACLDLAEQNLWVVADGMGGHSAGDFASQSIVKVLSEAEFVPNAADYVDQVEERLLAVNRALYDEAQRRGETIGSTVVLLLTHGSQAIWLWVGDSRIYRWRQGHLEQLSIDHTHLEEMIVSGQLEREGTEDHPAGTILTRAVGADPEVAVDMDMAPIQDGDVFLLCSDGLNKEVTDEEIAGMLADRPDPASAVGELVRLSLARGGRDNVTAAVVRAQLHKDPTPTTPGVGGDG